MKRILLIIGALLMGFAALGQSVTYTCRYWFDQQSGQAVTTIFSDSIWQAELDVGTLNEGLHTVHIHVMDTSMNWCTTQSFLFMKTFPLGTDTIDMTNLSYHCWFDQDFGHGATGSLGTGNLLLDVDELEDGLHTVHVMLEGSTLTTSKSYLFMKSAPFGTDTIDMTNLSYHCWFDQDMGHRVTDSLGTGNLLLDVSSLRDGLHAFHVMLEGSTLTTTQSYFFMKSAPFGTDTIDMSHLAYRCWFDQDIEHCQTDSLGTGFLMLDVEGLEEGLHTVHVMLKGSTLTSTQSYLFMKMLDTEDPTEELKYCFWFDHDYANFQSGLLGAGSFLLDVSELPSGLHTLNVQLNNGKLTTPRVYLFYKKAEDVHITKWEYYLNGDLTNKHTTELDSPVDSLSIISLLPVETWPVRSSCFHFHPNGDEPYLNAKNEITFYFWDTEDRWMYTSAYYVDESVVETIQAQVFERNTTETFAAPRDNQIQWFKLDALVGDSLSFIASKVCTMQLFAPSGEEVYSATASEAMVFGGCHAWEDGTYYLAVHDMTGSGETIEVTYNHFDRYVILACSPESVGNAVGSSFSFYYIGNGLESIENIYLTHEGDTLVMDTIPYSTVSRSYAFFNINNSIPNGMYDATFVFSDSTGYEIVEFANALLLEDPIYGDIIVSYNTPSYTARPFPVTITLENTGNIDYSYIPFNMAVDHAEKIENFNFESFCITKTPVAVDSGYYFNVITDNLFNRGINGCMVFSMLPALSAHERMTLWVSFDAPLHSTFNLYAWTDLSLEQEILLYLDTVTQTRAPGDDEMWHRYSNTINTVELIGDVPEQVRQRLPNPYRENLRGTTGAIHNASQITSNSIQIGGAITGIHWALENQRMNAYLEMGAVPMGYEDEYRGYLRNLPCLQTVSPFWGGLIMGIERLMGRQQEAAQIPTPDPGTPYVVHAVVPFDPNDIHGYLSESGSHYMRQEIQNVQYEIEFENDTTLATAAAHTIIVRDTLDATKFDLNSLAARSITIGDKRLDLNGEMTFARTLDLRPEIYVIAQIEQEYDPTTGIIQWTIQSLDPMTMEPTDDPNQGVLPVNFYGDGVGFIDYSIDIKEAFADGTEISNRAGIIFDQNDVIMTPTWTNIIDAVKPTSQIVSVEAVNDSLSFSFVSEDNRSGVWYHTLYYRNDSTDMEWQVRKPQILGNGFMLNPELLTTEYLVMAVDSAGNREEKEMVAEYIYYYDGPSATTQANALAQGWNWWSTYIEQDGIDGMSMLQNSLGHNGLTIKSQNDFTDNYYQDIGYDYWYGSLETLTNEQGYLINVLESGNASLTGMVATPANHPITIQPNWNWIGYPVAAQQVVGNALFGFNAAGDDVIKGQFDFASYYEGYGWYPDDFVLMPGQSYLYQSTASESKTLVYSNGNRGMTVPMRRQKPYWTCNPFAYPDNLNVMAVVAIDSVELQDEHWELGAFVNGECRGSARLRYFAPQERYYAMLTVAGQDGDLVEFRLANTESRDMEETCNNLLVFSKNAVVGSLKTPYTIHVGTSGGCYQGGGLLLFPNPVGCNQAFSVDIPQNEIVEEILISDVLGSVVRHETGAIKTSVIRGLPVSGVYVIKATTKSGNAYYGKLIVE